MIKFVVDDKTIEAQEGMSVLEACLENDIYIPHLCFMKGMEEPHASCRLCFVEIEGGRRPETACTTEVQDGMVIRTNTPAVRQLQRSALQLLLSVHDVDCAHCPANRRCALQDMARFLKVGLKPKKLEKILKEPAVEQIHPLLDYYPNRCVLCGRCIAACRATHGRPYLTFAKRGIQTVVASFVEKDTAELPCEDNPACVDVCPVSAIMRHES